MKLSFKGWQGWALVVAGVMAVAVMVPRLARSQVNASPSWVPIGVSASGTSSTVWFHEPSMRQAVACRTVDGAGAGAGFSIQCVAGRLP